MSASAPDRSLPAITFYGLQSKKRSLAIKRSLEHQSKRLRAEKIPDPYHSRILGPSSCWQIFHRQQEALDFVSSKGEDLHVFAFECQHPDKRSGQRQFLVATYPVFWHYYMQLDVCQRHHYEVIPEGSPCKLYFDLEFNRQANPSADGPAKVETLIKYVCCWLGELYGVQCSRQDILELNASTETKFSRHLIFQGKGPVFKDNVTEGVYTKNRNFRLFKSCKLGKTAAFSVAEENIYNTEVDDGRDKDRDIFLASLVTNVGHGYLTFGERPDGTQPPNKHRRTSGAPRPPTGEHIEGSGKSPYPEVDDFIVSQVSGRGGTIRRWTYFADAEVLTYDIMGYRFCYNVQRQHRSNNIKLVADLQKGMWYQKCYDPDCQAVNFKSEEFQLPASILPAYYLADDFDDLGENNVNEDDAMCLLALQDVEEQLVPE